MENINITNSSNLSFTDFPTLCRICLSKENLSQFNDSNLLVLFENVTNIKIEPEDDLPKNICESCLYQLQNISCFIKLSKCSDTTLRQILRDVNECSENAFFESDIIDDPEESLDCFDKNKIIKDELNEDDIELEPSHTLKRKTTNSHLSQPSGKRSRRHSNKRQLIKCEICGDFFSTKGELTQHQRKNINCKIKRYKCAHCEKAFFVKFRLKLHMRSHTRETPYECKICFKKFRHAPNLKRHDDIVHKGLKPFKCEVCGKEFSRRVLRNEHMYKHAGERPYICVYCGKSFRSLSGHVTHVYSHKIKNGEVPVEKTKAKRKYISVSDLKCNICNKTFSSMYAVNHHLKVHGEKSFLCPICGKTFLENYQLQRHSTVHTGEKPHVCQYCKKSFRLANAHKKHLLIHTGEKPHKCKLCQKTFVQAAHLTKHMRVHTGEKPYSCKFCGKAFTQNCNLKIHMRIHTGETPYYCSICGRGFYDSTNMKKHMKGHADAKQNTPNMPDK